MRASSQVLARLAAIPPGLLVVAAAWSVQQLPALPPQALCIALLLGGAALLPMGRVALPLGSACAGAGWAMLMAVWALEQRLPPSLDGRDLVAVGVVDQLPQPFERGLRFRFRVEHCIAPAHACPGPVTVRLSWYRGFGRDAGDAPPAIRPGQRWQLNLRLKRPHATLNPGLFDAELRALEEGIAASGIVRKGAAAHPNRLVDEWVIGPGTVVERLRAALRDRMSVALADLSPAPRGVVIALVIGDQAAIPPSWWEVFNRTGIGHLMSISGLHITMLAALAAGLTGRIWRSATLARLLHPRPLPAMLPTPYARWGFGVAVAFGYSALAGWGIPAQRTCWMLAAAGVALLSGRARSPVAVLSTAAAVVCVFDPWAPLAAGFWLSFGAVSAIVWYGSARGRRAARRSRRDEGEVDGDGDGTRNWHRDTSASLQPRGRLRARLRSIRVREPLIEALRAQYAATLVLLPLGVVFFASVALVSPFANAAAIPLVSALITPLALAGAAIVALWPAGGSALLALAGWLTDALLTILRWVDPGGTGSLAIPSPAVPVLLLASLACAWLLSPLPVPGRAFAALALLPLLLTPVDEPAPGELRLTALDVGQGTAVLVETGARRLLYDAGPQFGPDNDAGARVIVPYLRSRGIRRLDALVVSHLDLDHSGGALAVLRNLHVDWVASSLPHDHPVVASAARHFDCRRGERWQWADASFVWLHPGDERDRHTRSSTNARSCALRIDAPGGSALLAGDIEAAQERSLLGLFGAQALGADLLLAPHHGSATSSLPEFLDAVDPAIAIFQVGYRNRYRHPNARVLERYVARGIAVLRTDAHAAITVRLRAGEPARVARLRVEDRRYWRIRVDDAMPLPAPDADG